MTIVESSADIWVYEMARETMTRLTFAPGIDAYPVWTPDGKRVVFWVSRGSASGLYWKPADGSGAEERLTNSTNLQLPTAFSPDGKWLAFQESSPGTGLDIWVLPMEAERFFHSSFSVQRRGFSSPKGGGETTQRGLKPTPAR